jgi:hypothetical protein
VKDSKYIAEKVTIFNNAKIYSTELSELKFNRFGINTKFSNWIALPHSGLNLSNFDKEDDWFKTNCFIEKISGDRFDRISAKDALYSINSQLKFGVGIITPRIIPNRTLLDRVFLKIDNERLDAQRIDTIKLVCPHELPRTEEWINYQRLQPTDNKFLIQYTINTSQFYGYPIEFINFNLDDTRKITGTYIYCNITDFSIKLYRNNSIRDLNWSKMCNTEDCTLSYKLENHSIQEFWVRRTENHLMGLYSDPDYFDYLILTGNYSCS